MLVFFLPLVWRVPQLHPQNHILNVLIRRRAEEKPDVWHVFDLCVRIVGYMELHVHFTSLSIIIITAYN